MPVLHLVPNAYLRQFRCLYAREDDNVVMTTPGLVAQILKAGFVSYKEDGILEEVAIWQSVHDHKEDLQFFAPIAHYQGFIQELKWLFKQMGLGESLFEQIPQEGQAELTVLYQGYQQILKEHGILDRPSQIRKALELSKKNHCLPEVTAIQLHGLGELSTLEEEFLCAFAQERPLTVHWSEATNAKVKVFQASDPYAEVELIASALREQIERGVPLDKLGVAFPNPSQYLPIVYPVFKSYKIPWRTPTTSLRNTPLGKTLLNLLAGTLEGWSKQSLQLLTAPGWGFPFQLSAKEHRLLYLAPPLKGLPAWRHYLTQTPAWDRVIAFLGEMELELVTRSIKDYGCWLERLLNVLEPEQWVLPEENLEHWAELVKAWDGLYTIAQSLEKYEWISTPERFLQLLQTLLDNYQIQARRVFAEQVQVLSVDQLGAYTYEQLFVGGLIEGQFPQIKHAHWLTKTKTTTRRDELYQRLTQAASHVFLYYPEVDQRGKLNLPATILPKKGEQAAASTSYGKMVHRPSLFLGKGILHDPDLLVSLQSRILYEGLSVSQLNSYANCPFQFFCGHVLALVPTEEVSLELDARAHGTIVHNVLQGFWTEHLEGQLPSVEEAQGQIGQMLNNEYEKEGINPPTRLLRTMRDFIRGDLNMVEKGFRPKYLEKWFHGLAISTSFGHVEVRGRIDRIDLHPNGAYVLYDYKTGTAPTISSMLAGYDIQIATYLLAAERLLPQGSNVGVAYYLTGTGRRAGIFHQDYREILAIRRGPNVLSSEEFIKQNTTFTQILEKLVEKILLGQFPIEPADSRICAFCPFQGICRREVGR